MNCRHHEHESPCPVCAGLDEYAPVMYTPEGHIGPCTGKPMQKKLCLDGYGCYCEAIAQEPQKKGVDFESENRRMLTAFDAIATIACDMLDPVRRAGPGVRVEKVREVSCD